MVTNVLHAVIRCGQGRLVGIVSLLLLALSASATTSAQQVINFDTSVAPTATTSLPFSGVGSTMFQFWTASQLNSTAGPIMEFGYQMATPITGTWPRIIITMGETTRTNRTMSTRYATNFDVPSSPPVIVYDGPATISTTANNSYFRLPLTTPYHYSGTNALIVQFTVVGVATSLTGTPSVRVRSNQAAPSVNAYAYSSASSSTGLNSSLNAGEYRNRSTPGASFLIGTPSITGAAVSVMDVTTTIGTGPIAGSNVLRVRLKNSGTTDLSNIPQTIEYSTDGGVTWPGSASQQVNIATFGVNQVATVDLSASPWVLTTTAVERVMVRVLQATPHPFDSRLQIFNPDADVVTVSTGINDPELGANVVTVGVRNHGRFNLNGQILELEYSTDQGTNWTKQNFMATSLAAIGDEQRFTFNIAWMRQVPDKAYVWARISTPVSGDLDGEDIVTRTYEPIASPGALITYVAGGSLTNFPWGNSNSSQKLQTFFTPEHLGFTKGTISEIGFSMAYTTTGTWASIRIEIGEVNLAALPGQTLGSNFAANYNVAGAGPVTCLNGTNISFPTTVGSQYGMFQLTTPYQYSGQNALLVTWYIAGRTGGVGGDVRGNSSAPNNQVTAVNQGDAATGSISEAYGYNMRFQFAPQSSGLAVSVVSAGVSGVDLSVTGNTVQATIKNDGSVAWGGLPWALQYSTNGGRTFGTPQSFQMNVLQPGDSQTVAFTSPWTPMDAGVYHLVVRAASPVGVGLPLAARTYRPDADLELVETVPGMPVIGANTIRVSVRNNGNVDLAGVQIPVTYSVSGAAMPVSQVFTETTPWPHGALRVFDFTAAWNISAIMPAVLEAAIVPMVAGDPDGSDKSTTSWIDAGATGEPLVYLPGTVADELRILSPTGATMKLQYWIPAASIGSWGTITQFGIPFSAATHLTLTRLRIELGEVDFSALPNGVMSKWFASNYNVRDAGPVVAFDGPATVQTSTAHEPWRVVLQTPFYYTGDHPLLVTLFLVGSNPSHYTGGGKLVTQTMPTASFMTASYTDGPSSDGPAYGKQHGAFLRIDQNSGAAIRLSKVQLAGGRPALGNNVVQAEIKNTGSDPISSVTLEYSVDGGATFPASQSQTFALSPLLPITSTMVTFTTPWVVANVDRTTLVVRATPQVGSFPAERSVTFVPDLDIALLENTPTTPVIGSHAVKVTLRNAGDFDMTGVQVSLRYSGDRGATYATENVTLPAMATVGSTFTHTFTAPWVVAVPGDHEIRAEIHPRQAGDADGTDVVIHNFSSVGIPTGSVGTVNTYIATTGSYNYTFNNPFLPSNSRKLQTAWTPAQLGIVGPATLNEIGFRVNSDPFGGTWPIVRIYIGETTNTVSTGFSTNFDANFNVASRPKTKVFDGAMTVPITAIGEFWRVPISPFQYSGANNLLVTVYVESSNTSASIVGGRIHGREGGPCAVVYSEGQGDAAVGLLQPGITLSVSTRAILPLSGPALGVTAAGVAGGMAVVGQNTVTATVTNTGTSDLSNVPFTLDYSVDGGVTFATGTAQSFSFPMLAPSQSAPVTFSAPWTISQMRTHHLVVRVNPAIGSGPASFSYFSRPDVDLSDVRVSSSNPIIGDNPIQLTVSNNGGMSLNGHSLTVMYRVRSPLGEIATGTGTFVPTALGAYQSSETFTFPAPWQLSTVADATLSATIVTTIHGDPDASDEVVRHYPIAGRIDLEVGLNPLEVANPALGLNSSSVGMHFGYGGSLKTQSNLTPAQLSYTTGYITRFGIQLSEAKGPFSVTNLRVEIGGSTVLPSTASTNFNLNYNVPSAPKQVAFNGPFSRNFTDTDEVWYIDLTTPYYYNGEYNLLITTYVAGSVEIHNALKTRVLSGTGVTENFILTSSGNGDATNGLLSTNQACGLRFLIEGHTAFPSIDLRTVSVQGATLPKVGTNTVIFTAKNRSSTHLNSHAFTAEYSTDGGITWPSNQQQLFIAGAWPAGNTLNFQFTTPWILAAANAGVLVVRLNPVVGAGTPSVTLPFDPDLDIVILDTVPAELVSGQPATVRATVKNNGTLSLEGLQTTLRYSVNGGRNWIQEAFTLNSLASTGATHVLPFTQQWTPVAGNYQVMVEIVTPFSGDSDTWDGLVRSYIGVGSALVEIPLSGNIVTGIDGEANPFASSYAKRMMESLYLNNELTSAGLVAGSWIHGIQWKSTSLPFYDIENFRIRLDNTLLAQLPLYTEPFAQLQTVTQELQYGPALLPKNSITVGQWFGFDFPSGYTWDGTSGLLVEVSADNALRTTNFGNVVWRHTPVNRTNSAGFLSGTQVFPFSSIPHSSYGGVPVIRLKHGLAVVAGELTASANYIVSNGVKEVYLGETIPVAVELTNTSGVNMEVGSLYLRAVYAEDNTPCHAFDVAPLTAPVAVAANSSVTVAVQLSVAGTWSGRAGPVVLTVSGGLATVPSQPTTPAFLAVTGRTESLTFMPFLPPPPVQILTANLLPARVNTMYAATIAPTGGSGTYAVSVSPTSASNLPEGITLSTWATSGTPAQLTGRPEFQSSGTYHVTFQCVDGIHLVRKTLVLSVEPGAIDVSPFTLPSATEGVPYLELLHATGGEGPLSWSISPASVQALPIGMFLTTSGLFGGVPSSLTHGVYSLTFRCSDGVAHVDVTRSFMVNPTTVLGYVGPTNVSGRVSVAFHHALQTSGGTTSRQFSLATGSQPLPEGLLLVGSTGVIYGTPTATGVGTKQLLINLTDGVSTVLFNLTVNIVLADTLDIETAALPDVQVGTPWSHVLRAIGGSESYTWSMTVTPSMPPNLTLNGITGHMSFTPGPFDVGRYMVALTLSDGVATPISKTLALAVMKPGTLNIKLTETAIGTTSYFELANLGATRTDLSGWSFDIWVDSATPLALERRTFPLGTQLLPGTVLPVNFATSNMSTTPIPGSFDAGEAQIPTSPSSAAIAIWDAAGNLVDFLAAGSVQIATLQSANNGSPPIRAIDWGLNAQASMAGLVRFQLTDTNEGSDWAALTPSPGVWNPELAQPIIQVLTKHLPFATVNSPYSASVLAAAGFPPYTYTLSAPTAPWLSINPSTGELSGTPIENAPAVSPVFISVTDSLNMPASTTLAIAVRGVSEPISATLYVASTELSALRDATAAISVSHSGAHLPQVFEFELSLGTPEVVVDSISPGRDVTGLLIDVWRVAPGVYRIGGVFPDGAPSALPPESLFDMIVRTVPLEGQMAATGTFTVGISGASAADDLGLPLTLAGTHGTLNHSWFLPTDANRDGVIDVVDVQIVVNLILSLSVSQYPNQGDTNGDNIVDVVDIQRIVNCILQTGTCE